MRIYLKTILALNIILLGCSSDSETEENNDNGNNGTVLLLTGYSTGSGTFDDTYSIEYENGLVSNIDTGQGNFSLEYNSNGKVSTATNQFNEVRTYEYTSGRLGKKNYDGIWYDQFNYDSSGNIVSIVENQDDGYDESAYYTYNPNGSLYSRHIGGSAYTYTFEFDDKKNPFYDIWNKSGYIEDLEDAIYGIVPMFAKHNPVKIFRDGELITEINYSYNSHGYPITANIVGGGSAVYTYLD